MYIFLLLTFLILQDVENFSPDDDRMLDINEDRNGDIFEVSELPETGNSVATNSNFHSNTNMNIIRYNNRD